jgi:transcription-repair coupling factor (superfamily II helicase)
MEISMTAYIPDDYMPSESERVQMYKRILSADVVQLAKLKEELIDRCGPLPDPAKMVFDAAFLRLIAQERGLSEVHQETDDILVYFRPNFKVPEAAFNVLLAENDKSLNLIPGPPVGVRVFSQENEAPLDTLGRFLRLVFKQ